MMTNAKGLKIHQKFKFKGLQYNAMIRYSHKSNFSLSFKFIRVKRTLLIIALGVRI